MLVIPILILVTILVAVLKKIAVFDSFTEGIKDALTLSVELLPFLASIFLAIELMRYSGLSALIGRWSAPFLSPLGIPSELCELLILRPLSGSGSLALLEKLLEEYGGDSYIGKCASVIMAGTDTILYIVAVYFSTSKDKKSGLAIPIAVFASFLGAILACIICKIL